VGQLAVPRRDELTKVVRVNLGSVQRSYMLEPQDVADFRFAIEYELEFNAGERASFEIGIQICRNDRAVTLFMQFSATVVNSGRLDLVI
jgi:hypothetical protein